MASIRNSSMSIFCQSLPSATRRRVFASLLVVLGGVMFVGSAKAADIHVLATGALNAAFKVLGPAFEKESGHHLVFAWGPSYGKSADALPMRIKNGEEMDVCFMVEAAMDEQIKQGNFIPESRADLAESRIGIAVKAGVPKPDIGTVDQLRAALLAAKSEAFSEGASGKYISETLFNQLGIAEQMKPKSVQVPGRELIGAVLERGEAELGMQQISELRAFPSIQFVGPLPAEVQKASVISAAIAKGAKERQPAEALIAFLKSPRAAELMLKTGLDPIKPR